jgi:hypothetical protein
VSVRDADFEPIVNARVEIFRSSFARDAFDRSGRCIDRYVTASNPSFDPCAIDAGDARTDVGGNVELEPGTGGGRATITCETGTAYAVDGDVVKYRLEAAGLVDDEAEYKLWAWTGSFGDTVNSNTDLFEAVPANQQHARTAAVTAVFSGGTPYMAKMGSAVAYEIQLVDRMGRPVGPNPSGNQSYTVTIQTRDVGTSDVTIRSVATRTPDSDGNIRIVVTNPDPVIGIDNTDVEVSVTVVRSAGTGTAFSNTLRFVDTTGATDATAGSPDTAGGFDEDGSVTYQTAASVDTDGDGTADSRRVIGAQAPVERFSDNASAATRISVTPGAAGRVLASRNQNSLSVTVLDQYGNPFRGGVAYQATNTPDAGSRYPGNGNSNVSGALASNNSGRIYFNYNYVGNAATESIAIAGLAVEVDGDIVTAAGPGGGAASVYWADILLSTGSGGPDAVLLADPSSRRLFASVEIDGAGTPVVYPYGDDDSFLVSDGATPPGTSVTALSLAQFQEVLMVANSPSSLVAWVLDSDGAITDRLTWEGFNNSRPNDRATFTITGLSCTPPPGADSEDDDYIN